MPVSATQGHAESLRLLSEMGACGLQPDVDTYSTLMDAAVQSGPGGGKAEALQLLKHMQQRGLQPDAVVWTTLMKMYQRLVCVAGKCMG